MRSAIGHAATLTPPRARPCLATLRPVPPEIPLVRLFERVYYCAGCPSDRSKRARRDPGRCRSSRDSRASDLRTPSAQGVGLVLGDPAPSPSVDVRQRITLPWMRYGLGGLRAKHGEARGGADVRKLSATSSRQTPGASTSRRGVGEHRSTGVLRLRAGPKNHGDPHPVAGWCSWWQDSKSSSRPLAALWCQVVSSTCLPDYCHRRLTCRSDVLKDLVRHIKISTSIWDVSWQ